MTRETVIPKNSTCRHLALFLAALVVHWQAKGSSAFIVTNPAVKQATQSSRSLIGMGTTLVCRSTSIQGLLLTDASQGDVVSAAEESSAGAIEEEEASSEDESVNEKSGDDNVDNDDEKDASSDQNAEQAVQKERHTVFVGNLPFETTEAGLRDLFSEYGTVELVSIPKKPESGLPRGFAFVDMSSAEETQRVVDALNGADVSGRQIRVQISLPKEQADQQNKQWAQGRKGDGMQKIYVGNLPFDATNESVLELFSKYGEVKDVIFPLDRDTGKTRGFAFISLKTEEAEKAIAEVNGTECGGRTLTVSVPIPVGAKPSYQKRKPQQKLYVGNLSFYTSPDTLRELFEEFGPVHDCYLPEDPATGGSRGFGFVTLDREAATKAANAFDGVEVDGRMIRVNISQPKRSQAGGD